MSVTANSDWVVLCESGVKSAVSILEDVCHISVWHLLDSVIISNCGEGTLSTLNFAEEASRGRLPPLQSFLAKKSSNFLLF